MTDDNFVYLFYDKSTGTDHGYNNKLTKNITIDLLFTSDHKYTDGKTAINDFNELDELYQLPKDLNLSLYSPYFFSYSLGGVQTKSMIVGVNAKLLEKYVRGKNAIPQKDFLISLCNYNGLYNKATRGINILDSISENIVDRNIESIVQNAMNPNADPTDPIYIQPEFAKVPLYDYQKRTIKWMLDKELARESIYSDKNDVTTIKNVTYDTAKNEFIMADDRKKLVFCGGALIDEVGLGKTYQIIITSLLNQAKKINYYQENSKKLVSRATLVICPNQLSNQWIREFGKVIEPNYSLVILPLFTKTHFDKLTYQDILDADFVVTSFNYLLNDCFLAPILTPILLKKQSIKLDIMPIGLKEHVEKIGEDIKNSPETITKKGPNLVAIKWHRVIVDEFHEIETNKKVTGIHNIIKLFDSTYKWCMTATPFDKSHYCLLEMINFVTNHNNKVTIFANNAICNYMTKKFFRRNTKKSVNSEYQLPPLKENLLQLNFSQTEWLIYNAYIANPNIDKYSVLLRQICCQPGIAEEIKSTLSSCKTLEEIQDKMIKHYELEMNKAKLKVTYAEYRLGLVRRQLKIFIWKRQRKLLNELKYKVIIKFKDNLKELLALKDNSDKQEFGEMEQFIIDDTKNPFEKNNSASDSDDDKEEITISDENQKEIIKLVSKKWETNMPQIIYNAKESEIMAITKLNEETLKYNGKKTTYDYFNDVLTKLKKISDNNDTDSDSDDEEKDKCNVCLGSIKGTDLGMTKCGHIFCFNCVKPFIAKQGKCPVCQQIVKNEEMHMIIKYTKKETNSKEFKDKQTLISKVGTKLANLIFFLKKSGKHAIIFSQWTNLLENVGCVLDEHGIKNVFCKGNVWQRDKAIREFNINDKIKVIMLSSESAASGTNLTKAELVIMLDPVYGTYEYRRNMEWQAIGRAYRMGQQNQVEVVRIIIKGTVEEEIYKINKEEDKKSNVGTKIFELDENVTELDQDKINEIIDASKESKPTKKLKLNKKLIKDINVVNNQIQDQNDVDFDE